jgi:hypothetical protein
MFDEQAIELELDKRPTLGLDAAPPGAFTERVFLGRPEITDLGNDNLTAEQRQVLAQHPGYRFTRTSVSLTLVHDERNPFESVWLQITLQTFPTPGLAVARSMDPSLMYDATEITRTSKIGASLKFAAEHSAEKRVGSRSVYLEALYEGGETPTWSFTRTEQQIRGCYPLSMVVEADPSARVIGTAQLGATVRVYRYGIFSYLAKPKPETNVLFDVTALPGGSPNNPAAAPPP